MANFWEKLKKGMGVETPPETEEETKEKEEEKERTKEVSKEKKEEKEKKKIELKTKKIEIPEKKENWLEAEGQLAVDDRRSEKRGSGNFDRRRRLDHRRRKKTALRRRKRVFCPRMFLGKVLSKDNFAGRGER